MRGKRGEGREAWEGGGMWITVGRTPNLHPTTDMLDMPPCPHPTLMYISAAAS